METVWTWTESTVLAASFVSLYNCAPSEEKER